MFDLKPCKYCGGSAVLEPKVNSNNDKYVEIRCDSDEEWCLAKVVAWTEEEAIARWNGGSE